jgi:hypothetical protein
MPFGFGVECRSGTARHPSTHKAVSAATSPSAMYQSGQLVAGIPPECGCDVQTESDPVGVQLMERPSGVREYERLNQRGYSARRRAR